VSRPSDGRRRAREPNPDCDDSTDTVDPPSARCALARLACGGRGVDRALVRRARVATRDVTAAATFVDRVGLDRLRRAAVRLDGPPAAEARAALAAFERYRRAAAGE